MPSNLLKDWAIQPDRNNYETIWQAKQEARRREHYRGVAQFCVMMGVALCIFIMFAGLYQIGVWIAKSF